MYFIGVAKVATLLNFTYLNKINIMKKKSCLKLSQKSPIIPLYIMKNKKNYIIFYFI